MRAKRPISIIKLPILTFCYLATALHSMDDNDNQVSIGLVKGQSRKFSFTPQAIDSGKYSELHIRAMGRHACRTRLFHGCQFSGLGRANRVIVCYRKRLQYLS